MMRKIPRPSPATAIALIALLVAIGGTAYATGEGEPILGGQRNPGADRSRELTRETEIIADNSTYGTRQSNKSNNGGGAIYGCRSGAGGTPANNEPCVRANNLAAGLAFEFVSTGGDTAGRIETRDPNGKPFTTNATGVATGLNADRVDSLDANQIVTNARAGLSPLTKLVFTSSTASNADEAAARSAASEVELAAFGPFKVYGKCFVDSDGAAGAPEVRAEAYARTSQDGALLDSAGGDTLGGSPAYLDTSTAEDARQVDVTTASGNAAVTDFDNPQATLVAGNASAFEFRALTGAKQGALAAGNGVWGDGDRCAFGFSQIAGP
jgi:hypothetical protein